MRKPGAYIVKQGSVGVKPYVMAYKHYFPIQPTPSAVVVFIHGGGHDSRVWEETPDGRPGWAPLFAAQGREVVTLDWACASREFPCSNAALCRLTQSQNMALIAKVVAREIPSARNVVFFGWSMGGPQAFKLAADILPRRAAAILGYAATGPLNFFKPKPNSPKLDLTKPYVISNQALDKLWDSPFLADEWKAVYKKRYVMPYAPRMAAIQSKDPRVKREWPSLTIKRPRNIPPVLLINGLRDTGHAPAKEKIFAAWIRKTQKDASFKFLRGFSHLGMLARGNERIAKIYLDWLKRHGI